MIAGCIFIIVNTMGIQISDTKIPKFITSASFKWQDLFSEGALKTSDVRA